jgi:Fe-S oxidoreductase
VAVLDAAGYEVVLAEGRRCCGRPAASRGLLDDVRRLGEHNVALLRGFADGAPIVFLEPSCHSMFIDEYRQLRIDGAGEVAARCVLFEELLVRPAGRRSLTRSPSGRRARVAIHGHRHTKALGDAGLLPGSRSGSPGAGRAPRHRLLRDGWAFGYEASRRRCRGRVATPLVEAIESRPEGTLVAACGTSCRAQIRHLTDAEPCRIRGRAARRLLADLEVESGVCGRGPCPLPRPRSEIQGPA